MSNIILPEDNCKSWGASFQGKQVGALGVMCSYSIFPAIIISTIKGSTIVTEYDS